MSGRIFSSVPKKSHAPPGRLGETRRGTVRLFLLPRFFSGSTGPWLVLASIASWVAPLHAEQPDTNSGADGGAGHAIPDGQEEILVLLPDDIDGTLSQSLRDAVEAQLSDVPLRARIEASGLTAGDLRAQIRGALELLGDRHAAGVFWVDFGSADDWLVYLAEPSGKRVLVRRIATRDESRPAAVEAIAVIIRISTLALLEGRIVGMDEVAPPGPKTTAPTASSSDPPEAFPEDEAGEAPTPADEGSDAPARGFSLQPGYRGSTYAEAGPWQSGLSLSLGWELPSGLYLAGGAVLLAPIEIAAGTPLLFEVQRRPVELSAGALVQIGPLQALGTLAAVADIVTRRSSGEGPGVDPAPAVTRVVPAFGPRTALRYRFSGLLGLYAGGGIEFAPAVFPFVMESDAGQVTLLRPRPLRVLVEAGLLIHL